MTAPVAALARAEGVRLIRNPALWVALGLTGWWLEVAMRGDPAIGSAPLSKLLLLVGYGFVVPGLVLFVSVVMAVLRGRLEHTEELLGTLALGPDRRSLAHVLANVGPMVLMMLATIVILAVIRPGASLGVDVDLVESGVVDFARPNVAQLLQGPLAVLAFTTLAVALVRWIPTWLVIVPTPFFFMVQILIFGLFLGSATSAANWIGVGGLLSHGVVNGPWIGCGEFDATCEISVSGFDHATPWWHLGYLIALAGLFAAIAILRHRRDTRTWMVFCVSLVAVVALAVVQAATFQPYIAP